MAQTAQKANTRNATEAAGPFREEQLICLAGLLFTVLVVFHLASAAAGYPSYRDQHLGTALEYAKGNINLLKPVIVGFNLTNTPAPQEFPIWQALAGLAFKLMGTWYGWANVVSLLAFVTCLFPLFLVAQNYFGRRCACWTLVFFLAQPIIFLHAGTAGTDGFSLVAAIWFLFCSLRLLEKPGFFWWLATFLTGALSALSKMPFFMAAGLACFFMAVGFHRQFKPWFFLASAALLIGVVFVAWTRYCNNCYASAELPFVELRPSDPKMKFWYFGDLHYRLSPQNWVKGGWRVLNDCFGSFVFFGLFLYALLGLKGRPLAKFFMLGGMVVTLIFTHLVLTHSHYYLMFSPAIAMLCAQTVTAWEGRFPAAPGWKSWLAWGGLAMVFGLSLLQGLIGTKIVLQFDPYPKEMARIIQQNSAPTDKLLIRGGGWGGDLLFRSNRQGLSIWDTTILENPDNYRRLRQLGFNKLVMISESPLMTALQKSNPGQTGLTRETYAQFLTPVTTNWCTLLQNEDMLIKQIP